MLFAQIIAFILVMVVFEAYQPKPPTLSGFESIFAYLMTGFWFWFSLRLGVAFFIKKAKGHNPPPDPATAAKRFIAKAHGACVLCVLFIITILDLKAHLLQIDLFANSQTLSGLIALGIYGTLSVIVWAGVYPIEREVLGQSIDQVSYITGQARFVAPVAFPWFMVVVIQDLVAFVLPNGEAFLKTPLGDIIFLIFFLFLMAAFFPPLVRTWWGCHNWPQGPVRDLVETVLEKAGVSVSAILSWPILQGRLLTAGVLGVFARFRYLLLTPAITRELTPTELAGVIAHEAGHVHHKHLSLYLLFFLGYFIAAYALTEPMTLLLNLVIYFMANSSWGAELLSDSDMGTQTISIIMALPMVALMILYLRYCMGYFMRHFERQADFFALRFMGEAAPLSQALEKVAFLSGDVRQAPSWHHFSIAQRVEALEKAQRNPQEIDRHAQSIKKAFGIYAICLLLLVALGWGMAKLDVSQSVRQATIVKLIENKLVKTPLDHKLSMTLGILKFEAGEEGVALHYLKQAVRLAPRDPEALNSLAWFYATAQKQDLRDPRQALILAQKAVELAPLPHIWDTLAEAFFVNGRPDLALSASKAALAANPTQRRDYFLSQIKRFEKEVQKTK